MQRYEYVGGTSRKFWEVEDVDEQGKNWIVRVRYGRIGKGAQTHTKIFSYETGALRYRQEKILEKTRKGYVLKTPPKPAPKVQPLVAAWKPPVKPACQHVTITRNGNKYKCNACGDQVEFDKPQVEASQPEFQQRVRRYFAGASA